MKKDSVLARFTDRNAMVPTIIGGFLTLSSLSSIGALLFGIEGAPKQPLLGFVGMLLVGAFLLVWGIKKLKTPHNGKLFKLAAQLGRIEEIENYLSCAEKDGNLIFSDKRLLITKKYMVGKGIKGPVIGRTESLMWVYKHIHTINGIPTYYLIFMFDGQELGSQIMLKKDVLQKCLCEIEFKLPYVMIGFSKEMEKLFLEQRSKFVELWEEHKKEKDSMHTE